jgi:serine/threonine-protein kinase RsbW
MIPTLLQPLKIKSDAQHLRQVERLIEDVCQLYDVNEDAYGNMLIAVTEGVNNAMAHGNQSNPNKFVRISFVAENDTLIFSISDEGNGFDYTNLPDPTDPENISKISGRGVFLMSTLSDSILFEDNGKRVLLGFKNF